MNSLRMLGDVYGLYQFAPGTNMAAWMQQGGSGSAFFWSLSASPAELTLLCPERYAPISSVSAENGWRGFYFAGKLEFDLIGVLARLTRVLSEAGIGVLAISTFDTDYVFVPGKKLSESLAAIRSSDYELIIERGDALENS